MNEVLRENFDSQKSKPSRAIPKKFEGVSCVFTATGIDPTLLVVKSNLLPKKNQRKMFCFFAALVEFRN